MATKKTPPSELEQLASTVKLKLLDPFGKAIDGLKYRIVQDGKILARGVTDGQGQIQQFASHLGKELSVQVEQFTTGAMTQIHQLTPWNEKMSLKLVSGKVKHKTQLALDKGSPGEYKRKTHVVMSRDTLSSIASKNGTTAQAIAALNGIALDSVLQIDQVLKVPTEKSSVSAAAVPIPPAPAPAANDATATPNPETPAVEPSAAPATTEPAPAATANTPAPTAVPANVPPVAKVTEARGENGTPKATVAVQCNQHSCIKLGDKGPLIEELNIRLMGFGNTVSAPLAWNEFTTKTESAVKQFQRDYMGVAETGKVCGAVLVALDDFRAKHPVNLAQMKCRCGKCDGFGNGQVNSALADTASGTHRPHPIPGVEYPGIHRALLWSFRAAQFYVHVKDKELTYKLRAIESGYRCWYDNDGYGNGVANARLPKRNSTNHMGNALDVSWTKGTSTAKCQGAPLQALRDEIFIKRLGAQMGWGDKNKLNLEAGADAPKWVHMDVRELAPQYKDNRFYAVHQSGVDGDHLIDIAKREGRLALVACGGLKPVAPPVAVAPAPSGRVPVATLSLSKKGLDFLKGWEAFEPKPYDVRGHCTVGWGHLVSGKNSCNSLKGNPKYEKFTGGITQEQADEILKEDLVDANEEVRKKVQKPLLQQEYDALVSLIFNIGSFRKCPNLLSKLNTANYTGACDEFADITNDGDHGLVKRRNAEINMFRNNVYDSRH